MKKLSISLALGVLLTLGACSEYDFDSKYEDPSKVTTVSISNLMVGVFQRVKDYDLYEYNRFFGFDSQFVGKYAQTFGYTYSSSMYTPGYTPFIDSQWDNLYSALTQLRKLESLYNEESTGQQEQDEAFLLAARLQVYDFFAATVDVFGDMPFSKACTLPLTNDVQQSYAPYDKAEDIYRTILSELKEMAPRFRTIPVPRNFSTQDFINWGDMDKWERYANSLRLRLAMRVASQGELAEEGRAIIKEILENPTEYPLIEEQANNVFITNQKSGQLNFTAGSGLGDWVTNRLASGPVIDRMLSHGNYNMESSDPLTGTYVEGTDDPRILLYYNPVKIVNRNTGQTDEHRYLGTDVSVSDELTEYYNSQAEDELITTNKGFSQITQNGFFWQNDKFDMLIMASPEIHFIKAEAYAMGYGVAQDMTRAEEEFKTAVSQSIRLWYYYDSIGIGENTRRYEAPTDEAIATFADARWKSSDYTDKLDAIITQKWVHFAFLVSREAWSDLRRTGYPSGLVFPEVAGTIPNVPNRWRYPTTEVNYNPYYKDVQAEDTYYTKLFWAK
ncbi:conserved domain protein [Bacteroides sp. CAG:633]|uniref:SusD/RagB family nutrient-binding outer membrane lipoprotein n=1 Tax=Bacteroides sp. CAG:633 TaxID=1262744 RepID=UPI00033DA062|nr:SusD/RagB family nutrient-binding outer membrane lipoprotein [Bacteroides sp. CAG:633]CDB09904.1 conserved domain protein [Bacteroides sp. CAG:633]